MDVTERINMDCEGSGEVLEDRLGKRTYATLSAIGLRFLKEALHHQHVGSALEVVPQLLKLGFS